LLQQIPDVIRLEYGEPDFDPPEHVKRTAIEAIMQGKGKYVLSMGIPELREAISNKLKLENGIEYSSNEIAVTNGANGAIHYSLEAIVNEGDEVLIPDPAWANYEQAVKVVGGKPVFYPLYEENNFEPRIENIEKLVTNKTKAIIINSPNNPTGAVYSRKTLEEIANFVLQHDLYVLSDEVYEKFIYDDSSLKHVSIASILIAQILINAFAFIGEGAFTAYFPEIYRAQYRYTGSGISYQFAAMFMDFVYAFGLPYIVYLSNPIPVVIGVTLLFCILSLTVRLKVWQETRGVDISD